MPGKVYLVGAGPAGVEYLTIRARSVLEKAEVVLYDDLADPGLLKLAPQAECIDVGKRAGVPGAGQAQICQMLVEHCLLGQQVVRLKSGDPFIFGRAVEELEALAAAGCAFEVVPGVSSALSAPLFAGIPLTDKAWSRHFCVFSAHDLETLPWQQLAGIDTLVILMGVRQIAQIAEKLMDSGRPPAMPVAVIYWAGRATQRTITGTLETIARQVQKEHPDPAVIVVGPVVRHRKTLNWFDRRPLFGKTILITRSAEQASTFSERLGDLGARVLEMPALVVAPPASWDALDAAIEHIRAYRWLILTSANGVEAFFNRLHQRNLDLRALGDVRVAVVGPKTAQVARQYGLIADFVPTEFVADRLLDEFPDRVSLSGARVLFVRVESGGREAISRRLTEWGALVDEVAGYATGCPTVADPECVAALRAGQVDCVTFASAKTVRHFAQLLKHEDLEKLMEPLQIASIGPQTSIACRECLGRVDIEAGAYTLDGLAEALVGYFQALRSGQAQDQEWYPTESV